MTTTDRARPTRRRHPARRTRRAAAGLSAAAIIGGTTLLGATTATPQDVAPVTAPTTGRAPDAVATGPTAATSRSGGERPGPGASPRRTPARRVRVVSTVPRPRR